VTNGTGKVKGIILAGGSGTRLYPLTHAVSKQLMPVYDKPMIYYPLATLMLTGLRDILLITTPEDMDHFRRLLGDGERFGIRLSYTVQPRPEGLAQAFLLGKSFIGTDRVCLILGDNIFYGHGLNEVLRRAAAREEGGTIFAYRVRDPERYGVVSFDRDGRVTGIEEKPERPRSRYAVPGIYFYDNKVVDIAASLTPSGRGELEITDVNRAYLEAGALRVEVMGRGIAWLDTGTHDSLLQAQTYIATLEARQGLKVACLEEIAYRMGYIPLERLEAVGHEMKGSTYGRYLLQVVAEERGEFDEGGFPT
jgi:glucose-1-phosphate thymidylyltransferase